MIRQKIICGNWKMYKTIDETIDFIKRILPVVEESSALVYLAVPFTAIYPAVQEAKNTKLVIGAQNMNDASEGAFTGEVAGKMLKNAGASFVILGHSERRRFFGETDEVINKKVQRALKEGLQPMICIGETLEEKEAQQTEDVLNRQLSLGLANLDPNEISRAIIAYEPLWAIGSGHTATPETAEKMQAFCRRWVAERWGEEAAQQLHILYGGSVKPENASSLMSQQDVDGALIGSASLIPDAFTNIIKSCCEIH